MSREACGCTQFRAPMTQQSGPAWRRYIPAARWLAGYRVKGLPTDALAGAMLADGDAQRYAQIASLTACVVALLCLLAWLLRLSVLVRLISDSILVGFKAGAGLTIAMTQMPSLLGVASGGHNFFERTVLLAGQLGQVHALVFALGIVAILLLVLGDRLLPAKPVALAVVALSIVVASVL